MKAKEKQLEINYKDLGIYRDIRGLLWCSDRFVVYDNVRDPIMTQVGEYNWSLVWRRLR